MVCSAWNPIQMDRMALPPCHFAWGLVHIEGTLSLYWVQRSCDLMLGVPFNIASYGLLLQLLCTEANMKPGNLTGILADCHIYENQIPGAKEQLSRLPNSLPNISIFLPGSIFNWTHNNFTLNDYNPQERIDFGSVAV
jgi:thymidylate synthase